jgi:hypothetical protein
MPNFGFSVSMSGDGNKLVAGTNVIDDGYTEVYEIAKISRANVIQNVEFWQGALSGLC